MLPRFSDPPTYRPRVPGYSESTKEHFVSIEVANEQDVTILFYLEPWGEILSMPPHSSFIVEGVGPESGTFDVIKQKDGITVWAWWGAWVRLFYEDVEIWMGHGPEITRYV
ncbi:MAG: hypothetical protein ACYDBJ_06885 [Aggregatilineales bacterium]